jgi:DNA repair exonuclease SbcCD nuclease subunit
MSGELIRFLHASDFHLEQPLYGMSAVPDHLRSLMVDAPYQAATRVFDSAILEHVDFVLLSGDIADLGAAGPRAIAFLLEQFERLREKDIAVYWAGGKIDEPESWPNAVPLPDNVHYFAAGRTEELLYYRSEQSHAAILGTSWTERHRSHATDLRGEATERFKIGV